MEKKAKYIIIALFLLISILSYFVYNFKIEAKQFRSRANNLDYENDRLRKDKEELEYKVSSQSSEISDLEKQIEDLKSSNVFLESQSYDNVQQRIRYQQYQMEQQRLHSLRNALIQMNERNKKSEFN